MRNALIGIAVVALALSSTFGATVYFSQSATDSGYAAATNPTITASSGTLYIWIMPGGSTTDSKITSASINIVPTAGVKFSNPQIINPSVLLDPEDPESAVARWETSKNGTVTANGGILDMTGYAVTAASYGIKKSSTLAPYNLDTFKDAAGAYLYGSVNFLATADSTASFVTGDGTWANDKGIDVMCQYGFGDVSVLGKNPGTAGNAADVTFDPIPEPATMALLTIGGIAGLLRRRNA